MNAHFKSNLRPPQLWGDHISFNFTPVSNIQNVLDVARGRLSVFQNSIMICKLPWNLKTSKTLFKH
jgi:hypothetical protein